VNVRFNLVVPVRIAPSATGLNLTFTSPTAVNDTVTIPLNATVTATAAPGTRFTSTTAVRMMTGPLTTDASFFSTKGLAISADSLSLTFLPGPNSTGHMEVSGVASISTPTLKTTARSHTQMITDQFDTNSSSRLAVSVVPAAIGDTVTVTLPPEYRFSPNTRVTHIRDTIILGLPVRVTTNGLATPIVVSVSADSGTLKYLPAPGAYGSPRFDSLHVRNNSGLWSFASRTNASYVMPSITLPATINPGHSVNANTPVTIVMPAGFKTRPNTAVTYPGSKLPAAVLSFAADSSSVTFMPTVNLTGGTVTLSNLMYTAAPAFKLTMPTIGTLQVAYPTDLGADDPVGSPTFAAPTVTGNSVSWVDRYSMTQPDPSGATCDGAVGAQFYTLTVSVTGNYNVSMNWSAGSDFDFGIMLKDGTYGGPGCSNYISTNGLNNKKPETTGVVALTAGQTYVINAMDFAGDGHGFVQIIVSKVP
jgi:hypothetical protein